MYVNNFIFMSFHVCLGLSFLTNWFNLAMQTVIIFKIQSHFINNKFILHFLFI